MTVFRVLPIGGTPPKLAGLEPARVAAATAAEVHPLVCKSRKCQWVYSLRDLSTAGKSLRNGFAIYQAMCVTAHKKYADDWETLFVDAKDGKAERLILIGQHTENSCLKGKSKNAGYALREAVKLVVSERGISDGVQLVAGIARRCGMAVESV